MPGVIPHAFLPEPVYGHSQVLIFDRNLLVLTSPVKVVLGCSQILLGVNG